MPNNADDCCADARTYYSRLQANHGMDFAEAKQYRDNYIQDREDRGVPVNNRNGMYISSSIKDQGKTGSSSHTLAQVSVRTSIGHQLNLITTTKDTEVAEPSTGIAVLRREVVCVLMTDHIQQTA